MGMWAFMPWDNDQAADWYSDFMQSTNFRNAWLRGINSDPIEEPDVVRAAAALFVMLGRVYIWPVKAYDEDLERTITALEKVAKCEEYQEVPELLEVIAVEIAELKTRRNVESGSAGTASTVKPKAWWKIW